MDKIAQIPIGQRFNSPWGQTLQLGDLVSLVLSNAVAFAGVIVFFLFLGGGIAMLIGAGRGDAEATGKGRQALTAALIGFVIIFAAYWIVRIVGAITGIGDSILSP